MAFARSILFKTAAMQPHFRGLYMLLMAVPGLALSALSACGVKIIFDVRSRDGSTKKYTNMGSRDTTVVCVLTSLMLSLLSSHQSCPLVFLYLFIYLFLQFNLDYLNFEPSKKIKVQISGTISICACTVACGAVIIRYACANNS